MRQHLAIAVHHLKLEFSVAVASVCHLLNASDAALNGFEVAQLKLGVDHLLVAHRVNRAINVRHILIVEAAEHMNDGICLANVGQKLIAQALALACALHQAGNVHNLDGGGHDALRVNEFGKFIEAFVRNGDYAHIGFDCTEWEVCRLSLGVRQTVEKRGLAHIRKPYDTTLKCHILILSLLVFKFRLQSYKNF